MTTLDLHGRFTLIHDIAGVYLNVSTNYIRPGMERMDDLTFLDDDEYQEEMIKFREWGNEAVKEINTLATVVCLLAPILDMRWAFHTKLTKVKGKRRD